MFLLSSSDSRLEDDDITNFTENEGHRRARLQKG
jgi:hypothetical protein